MLKFGPYYDTIFFFMILINLSYYIKAFALVKTLTFAFAFCWRRCCRLSSWLAETLLHVDWLVENRKKFVRICVFFHTSRKKKSMRRICCWVGFENRLNDNWGNEIVFEKRQQTKTMKLTITTFRQHQKPPKKIWNKLKILR